MADETTESFVSRINVRELISIFENKKEATDFSYSRPRAKSWGNLLADDVVIRYNDYYTLEDINDALEKVEVNLNFYLVYDKRKHVAFQEQLFNILTSVVNIESETDNDRSQKKNLITKTQTLVSFLNQKLPNVRSPVQEAYSRKVAEYNNDSTESSETLNNNTNNNINDDVIDAPVADSREYTVSVKKLKENFQTKQNEDEEVFNKKPTVTKNSKLLTQRTKAKRQQSEPIILTNGSDSVHKETTIEPRFENTSEDKVDETEVPPETKNVDPEDIEPEEVAKVVSVSKLRNLFEEKSKEESSGLQVVLDTPRTFHYDVHIPYTEGLLRQTDLNRKRADITRSKSMRELNYDKYVAYKDHRKVSKRSPDDSGDESDTSSASIDSVKEVKVNQWSAIQVRVGNEECVTRTVDTHNEENFQSATLSETQHSHLTIENQSTGTLTIEERPDTSNGQNNRSEIDSSVLKIKPLLTKRNVINSNEDHSKKYNENSSAVEPNDSADIKTTPVVSNGNGAEEATNELENNSTSSVPLKEDETEKSIPKAKPLLSARNLASSAKKESGENNESSSPLQSDEQETREDSSVKISETKMVKLDTQSDSTTSEVLVSQTDTSDKLSNHTENHNGEEATYSSQSVKETSLLKESKIVESKSEVTTISGFGEAKAPSYTVVNDTTDISLSSINTVQTDFSIDDESLNKADEEFDKLLEKNEIH